MFSKKICRKNGKGADRDVWIWKKIPILKLRKKASNELIFLSDYIYRHVFLGYTQKQWDLIPEELDASVTARVPVYVSRDNRYFQDSYQVIPQNGYTDMFKNILNHPNIHILLNTDYREIIDDITFNKMIYSGPLDAYYDYIHGELPYRTLTFELKNIEQEKFQQAGIVTYPNIYSFTRITEFKYLTGQFSPSTTVAYEFPQKHKPGKTEPYYPVPRQENRMIYSRYKKETDKLKGRVIFAGRLADYSYFNMDQAVARALSVFEKEII